MNEFVKRSFQRIVFVVILNLATHESRNSSLENVKDLRPQ